MMRTASALGRKRTSRNIRFRPKASSETGPVSLPLGERRAQGASVLYRDADGEIFSTDPVYQRGLELMKDLAASGYEPSARILRHSVTDRRGEL